MVSEFCTTRKIYMSKVLSLITTLVIASNVYSQMDTTKIAFVSYWFVGDSYNYRLSKIKELWKEGHLTKDQQQDYRAGFTVIDSTATSYTIKWTYENNLSKDLNIPAVLMDTFSTYKLTEIKYKTSALGVFLEILNWREVGELMNKMFDDLVTFWGEKDKEEKERLALFLRPYKEIYSSKQGIEQLVLKELQYIHFRWA